MRGSEETLGLLEGRHHVAPLRREERNKGHIIEFCLKVYMLISYHSPFTRRNDDRQSSCRSRFDNFGSWS